MQRKLFLKDRIIGFLGGLVIVLAIDLMWIHQATLWYPWPSGQQAVAVLVLLFGVVAVLWADDDGLNTVPPCTVTIAIFLLGDLAWKFLT